MSRINWTAFSPATPNAASASTTVDMGFRKADFGLVVAAPWAAMYRLAYEQAVAANAPSRLQRMMEPCWN